MCEGQPVSVASALGMLDHALGCLATVDTAGLPTAVQAEALLALERAEARHTAARARLLAAFAAQGGYERSFDDEHKDADDAFADRYLRLGITFQGAGRAEGDLTPGCAAAVVSAAA